MARTSLPPGFRFHPTDVELVKYYLKKKVLGKKLCFDAIAEVNIYKYSPWDLPDKSILRSGDLEWYFFSPQQRKYASGARTNRATETGYWKATGKDRVVLYNEETAGMVKTLIFHMGHPPKGERTDWVMHEYRMTDKKLSDAGVAQDSFVVCKIFQKSGPGPKNGAQYGAPFCEQHWDDDDDEDADSLPPAAPRISTNDSAITTSLPGGSTSCGPSYVLPAPPEAPCLLGEVLPPALDNEVSNHLVNTVLPTDGAVVATNFSGSTYAGGALDGQDPLGGPGLKDESRPLTEDDLDRLLGMFTEDIVLPGQDSFTLPFDSGFSDGAGPSRVIPSFDELLPHKPDDDGAGSSRVPPSVDEVFPHNPVEDDEINYLLGMFKEDDCSLGHMFGNSFF